MSTATTRAAATVGRSVMWRRDGSPTTGRITSPVARIRKKTKATNIPMAAPAKLTTPEARWVSTVDTPSTA
ncbi:MAG: hypothetical protein WKF43_05340 [Acidimicrobiales bacterium]